MKVKIRRKDEFQSTNKIEIQLKNGEILRIEEDRSEIKITSTNDDYRILIRPLYSNQFELYFIPNEDF